MRYFRATIRFILFFGVTYSVYFLWYILSFVIPNKPYWRQIIFRIWARSFLAISGMQVEIIGEPPRAPFLLVSNHLSYVDIPAFRAILETVFVAKSDVKHWLFAGSLIREMGTIFIDRNNRRDIPRVGNEIIKKLDEGEGVLVFPEGTSTKGEDVLPFNSSLLDFAARAELPVWFASISYRTPKSETFSGNAICWWDETVFIEHLWRLFSIREFTAIINFGEIPITHADRKLLAHELRERVKEKFIPVL